MARCSPVLAWEEGASRRDQGWGSEKTARNWRAIGPPFREKMVASLVGPLVVHRSMRAVRHRLRSPLSELSTSKLGGTICSKARGTRVLRALLCGAPDGSRKVSPAVVFRRTAELTQRLASRSLSRNSQSNRLKSRMSVSSMFMVEYSSAPRLAGARRAIACCLLGGLLTVLHAVPALAEGEFAWSSVKKGVLLVASPSLNDPNFREAVVLIVEHGPEGTLGLILNRSTKILLSEALPELTVLKGTSYRLFAGGPVQPTQLLLLFRLKEPPADARSVFDGVYIGGTPKVLESLGRPNRPKPSGLFPDMPGGLRSS